MNISQILLVIGLLATVAIVVYFNYDGLGPEDPQPVAGLMQTEAEFRDKLTELRMQRNKVQKGIRRLENLKAETIQNLRDKGIRSGSDYKNSTDKDVKFAVNSLKEYAAQIAKIENEVKYYDEAIEGITAMLERIERERIDKSVALSEQEYLDLQKIIVDLNERLEVKSSILEEEELAELLDLEMTNDK